MSHRPSTLARQSGQVMPLGAVSLLALALMVFISLNVASTVRNRIRLQNYADAKAYSLAVAEARTFNFYAYTNRAIANAYVDMATLHAYMSTVAMMATVDQYMFAGFVIIAAEEAVESAASFADWDVGDGLKHAWHATEAGINSVAYLAYYAAGRQGGRLRKIDKPFKTTMDALALHIDALWGSEQAVKLATEVSLLGLDNGIAPVRDYNMKAPGSPGATFTDKAIPLGVLNAKAYSDAIDDSTGSGGTTNNKRRELTNVVNATRPPFTWDRNSAIGELVTANWILAPMFSKIKSDAPMDSGDFWPGPTGMFVTQSPNVGIESGGRSGLSDGKIGLTAMPAFGRDVPESALGRNIDSWDWCMFGFGWHDALAPPVPMPLLPLIAPFLGVGELRTGKSGSVHSGDNGAANADLPTNRPHDSSAKHDWDTNPSRFMDFKITANAPYGQPVVYSYVSSDLRTTDTGGARPWEINPSGVSVDVGGGAQGKGKLSLAADPSRGKGRAIGKAMVYYHRFGDWREPPNFFNPYWRAKMDSFDNATELAKVIAAGEALDSPDPAGALSVGALRAALGPGAANLKQ
jgi:hypothetical protein